MIFNLKREVGARFKLIVRSKTGDIKKQSGWSLNLVLDTGLDRMSEGTWINRCVVGSGNSLPVATQSMLDNRIASTTTIKSSLSGKQTASTPYYRYARVEYRFNTGAAAGNLSEIGLGWGDDNLWNRALIQDESGNPTTITVLPDEILDVIAEVRDYPASSSTGVFQLEDKNNQFISEHTYNSIPLISYEAPVFDKISPRYLYVYDGPMGSSITNYPTGLDSEITALTTSYPTPRVMRVQARIETDQANFNHKSFALMCYGLLANAPFQGLNYKFEINPAIPKNNEKILEYTFEIGWSRYEPT